MGSVIRDSVITSSWNGWTRTWT